MQLLAQSSIRRRYMLKVPRFDATIENRIAKLEDLVTKMEMAMFGLQLWTDHHCADHEARDKVNTKCATHIIDCSRDLESKLTIASNTSMSIDEIVGPQHSLVESVATLNG